MSYHQLLTNSAHRWSFGNQLELYFNPSQWQTENHWFGTPQQVTQAHILTLAVLPVPSPYWFSMPCPPNPSLNLWSQVQMPPSTGKSPFLFIVLSIPSTRCGANSHHTHVRSSCVMSTALGTHKLNSTQWIQLTDGETEVEQRQCSSFQPHLNGKLVLRDSQPSNVKDWSTVTLQPSQCS